MESDTIVLSHTHVPVDHGPDTSAIIPLMNFTGARLDVFPLSSKLSTVLWGRQPHFDPVPPDEDSLRPLEYTLPRMHQMGAVWV